MRTYKTNSEMPWYLFEDQDPLHGQMIFILVEQDTCDEDLYPVVRKVIAETVHNEEQGDYWKFKLMDEQDDDYRGPDGEGYLNGNWNSVRAWRAMTDTGLDGADVIQNSG